MSLVRIIKPEGYPHWRCFVEVAKSIELSLPEGWERPIIFGANLLKGQYFLPEDSILFNLEAWSSPWMDAYYIGLLRLFPVLDYAQENVDWLRERGVDAHYCPIRYHPHLTRLTLSPTPDIDVLFYGSLNMGRRPEILKAVEATGLRCLWLDHSEWGMRDEAICRSKIVLNLHAYPQAPLEMARISYLLANGVFVLSEGPICPVPIQFIDPEYMAQDCLFWATDEQLRRNVAKMGFERYRQESQADALKTALAELTVAA